MKPDIRTRTAYPPLRTQFAQRLWCPSPGWTPCHALRAAQVRHAGALQPVHTQDCQPDGRALAKLRALTRTQRYAQNELAQLEAELAALLKTIGPPPQGLAACAASATTAKARAKHRRLKGLQIACRDIREELAWIDADLKAAWDEIEASQSAAPA
jgi:hypothetical protein